MNVFFVRTGDAFGYGAHAFFSLCERVRVECAYVRVQQSNSVSLSNPGFICWSLRWERHQDVSHLAGQPKPLYFHCHWNPFGRVEIYLDSLISAVQSGII